MKTYKEKKEKEGAMASRQNTKWEQIVRKCKHKWQPIQMVMEYDTQPDTNNAKVYCVCMKCCAYTYIVTAWAGFYINSPNLLECK